MDIYGHRGARGNLPENTIASFIYAIEHGVKGIELDLVVTKEKQLLVSHEPYMACHLCLQPNGNPIVNQEQYNIYEMLYEDILLFDCGSLKQDAFTNQKNAQHSKPLFKDILKATMPLVKQGFTYLIEIKSDRKWYGTFQPDISEYCDLIINEVQVLKSSPNVDLIIQSFDPAILNRLHKLDEELKLGFLIEEKLEIDKQLSRLNFIPYCFNPEYTLVDQNIVNIVHEKEMKIFCWTVNNLASASTLTQYGVDSIITDYPSIF